MRCNTARKLTVTGSRRRSASAHVGRCPDCQAWLAQVQHAERLLVGTSFHPLPPQLEARMHAAAQEHLSTPARIGARTTKQDHPRRFTLQRTALLAVAFAAAALIGLETLSGGRAIALSDLKKGLQGIDVVHISGLNQAAGEGGALVYREDKWIRQQPPEFFEQHTPARSDLAAKFPPYTVAGNGAYTWFYSPNRKLASVVRPLAQSLVDEMMQIFQPFARADGRMKVIGTAEYYGVRMDLVSTDDGEQVLTIDPASHRAFRYQQFEPDAQGTRVEVADLSFAYGDTPPANTFDWRPPKGTTIVDKHHLLKKLP